MKKEHKIWLIVGLIILALLLIKGCPQPTTGGSGDTTQSVAGGGSGGGGGTTETTTDEGGFQFWAALFDWWQSQSPQCSRDSDCEPICANPTYARCEDGSCSCSMPVTEEEAALPVCERDSDCDYLCAASNAGVCTSGECGCATPVEEDVCVDSDFGRSSEYEYKGTCQADSTSRSVTDYCVGGILIEYSCRAGTTCSSEAVDCSVLLGRNGACIDGICTTIA